ncbi:uncharacterized protein LOC108087750 isoform X2 [Drosophila ficusphila]|uniref:uncharacterized protein LOC108087750 isoform X2 n=1 Tax=Drosophila ficusphila TaxID=30025 RepID=UPI0007E5EC60|nr:uncharacterized protein LOC108087750 isoform X2 [Drosophila ficusphila]
MSKLKGKSRSSESFKRNRKYKGVGTGETEMLLMPSVYIERVGSLVTGAPRFGNIPLKMLQHPDPNMLMEKLISFKPKMHERYPKKPECQETHNSELANPRNDAAITTREDPPQKSAQGQEDITSMTHDTSRSGQYYDDTSICIANNRY